MVSQAVSVLRKVCYVSLQTVLYATWLGRIRVRILT